MDRVVFGFCGMTRAARLGATLVVIAPLLLSACLGGNGTSNSAAAPAATPNIATITVDGGPASAGGQLNHPYVTVKVCPAGTSIGCASIDHVLLDTGSTGLRLVGSVLSAAAVSLTPKLDSQGHALEECASFNGGQTWGPVVLADVSLAGEIAARAAVQIMDDTSSSAPPPATCGPNGSLINSVSGFGANGVLGVAVLLHDCPACESPAVPLPFYYGCTSAGDCSAENVALADQVSNVVAQFAADNNGIVITLPNLVNANGDSAVQGELIFGLATQADNALPASGLTVLGADASGQFTASYNGSAPLPALIDSGTDSYAFDDPTIAACTTAVFIGYYCPTVAPLSATTVNNGAGAYMNSSTINFAIADPNSFVLGAAAFAGLAGGGGSTRFIWGMPFFYGRTIYFGFEQRAAGGFTGPFYAY